MDNDKVKRTYYLNPDTIRTLNNYVVSYCADPDTGSTYGAHSNVVEQAIITYTSSMTAKDEPEYV